MPTATTEKICSRLGRLSASSQAMRQHVLAQGNAVLEAQRGMRQDLTEGLREGMEREALLGTLAAVRSQAEGAGDWFRKALAIFAGDAEAAAALEAQLHKAEGFLAWVQDLGVRVFAPAPPFDVAVHGPTVTAVQLRTGCGISRALGP